MDTAELTSIYEAVLSQEMLLKKIIGYALNFASVYRLVNKQWLLAATRQCRKSRTPLFTISAKFSFDYCIATIEKIKLSLSSSLDDNCVPPIKLKIYDTALLVENQHDFNTVLLECASSLMGIELYLAGPQKQLVSSLPSTIKLPILRCVKIYFFQEYGPLRSKLDIQNLLNNLFRVSSNITKITTVGKMPGNLVFPASVRSLELNSALLNAESSNLLRNTLPNLQHLQLDLQSYKNFTKVLAKFAKSLRSFTILEKAIPAWKSGVELQLPLIRNLKTMEILSASIVLPDVSTVKEMLPNLEVLTLPGHAIDKFVKEAKNLYMPTFDKIKDLTLLRRGGEVFGHLESTLLQNQIKRGVSLAFPNLIKLVMELSVVEMLGLNAVFDDMPQLNGLKITIEDYSGSLIDPTVIDSVLTGWRSCELTLYSYSNVKTRGEQNKSGIKRMTELEELGLYTADFTVFTQRARNASVSVFSDLSFHLAFFEMPKLRKLCFGGRFKVTNEMYQKWNKLGKSIFLE